MIRHAPNLALLLAGIFCGAAFAAADEESPAEMFTKYSSPDGRFALHAVMEGDLLNGIQIIEAKSGRVLADLSDEVMFSQPEELSLLWTPDSKCCAANFRSGGRYNTTKFFRWDGKTLAELVSPEGQLYEKIVEPAKRRDLKTAGKPEDTRLRRIWDTWETVKWLDDSTAEIHGESTSAYYENDEPIDIAVGVDATVRFDKAGEPQLVKTEEVPAGD